MARHVSQRLILLVGTLIGVLTVTFALTHILPGSPVEVMLGHRPTPDQVEALIGTIDPQTAVADERAYLDEWPMTEAQKRAVLDRDYNATLDQGGNIYFLAKIFATDGLSYVQAVSTMTGMSVPDYQQMMLDGGRSPDGWRSVKEGN